MPKCGIHKRNGMKTASNHTNKTKYQKVIYTDENLKDEFSADFFIQNRVLENLSKIHLHYIKVRSNSAREACP